MIIVIQILRILSILPQPLQEILGKLFGKIALVLNGKRVRYARKNIEICFPENNQKSNNGILVNNCGHMGRSLFNTAIAWFWSNDKIRSTIPHVIHGLDPLINNPSGGLIIFKHSLHLELDARILGMHLSVFGMGRNHNNGAINKLQDSGRLKSLKGTIDRKEVRKLVKLLSQKEFVMYAIDQDYGKTNAELSNFFGIECFTINTVERLQRLTNCRVYFLDSWMDNHLLNLEITECKNDFSERAITRLIEDSIKKKPEEYLWQHRRFKSSLGKKFYE